MTATLRGLLAGLALLLALADSAAVAQPRYPPLSGRVVDAANILPAETEASLTQRLAALETSTGRQLVVATVPSLGGYEIEEYGYGLGRAWGVGARGRNDGALLIVAPNERKVRIEVGYGLEGVLTDAWTGQVLRQQVLPRFRAGDMPGGVVAGADAVIAQLTADPEAARRNVAQATAAKSRGGGVPFGSIIITLLIIWLVFSVIGGLFGRGRRGRRRGGGGGWIVPAVVFGSGLGRGGWSGGSGGFGGGGFSGGGGSFGGGGSSGGW